MKHSITNWRFDNAGFSIDTELENVQTLCR
jgi:hypothetical protein